MGQVKRAAPDGYTLLVSSLGPFVIAPHLIKSVPYDMAKDFDLTDRRGAGAERPRRARGVAVQDASPTSSTASKKTPGKLTFASSGNGSSDHLTAELFWQQTGTSGVHVPYKGGGPAMNDLLGGVVDASFQNINAVVQHVAAGKLRALAITGDKRSPLLPQVPTLAEAGVKRRRRLLVAGRRRAARACRPTSRRRCTRPSSRR